MRKWITLVLIASLALSISLAAGGPRYGNGNGRGNGKPTDIITSIRQTILSMPKQPLSDEEIKGLIQMREEEKLARDVYLTLYEIWKLPIFKNIASSEQTHTDAVKVLLEKYGLEDPVKSDKVGEFTSKEMRKLYEELVEKGKKSLLDALIVGATVEDLDIKDLQDLLKKTDNEDIKFVYENLMKGSRNHLRSFYSQIKDNGGDYKPQYITLEEFRRIISTPIERGSW